MRNTLAPLLWFSRLGVDDAIDAQHPSPASWVCGSGGGYPVSQGEPSMQERAPVSQGMPSMQERLPPA